MASAEAAGHRELRRSATPPAQPPEDHPFPRPESGRDRRACRGTDGSRSWRRPARSSSHGATSALMPATRNVMSDCVRTEIPLSPSRTVGREAGERVGRQHHLPADAGGEQQVAIVERDDQVIVERLADRQQDRGEAVGVDLVGLHPLHEQSSVGEVPRGVPVELHREQAGDPADPRIRRLGHDHVVGLAVGREERLRVVDVDRAARVIVDAPVEVAEVSRQPDHRGLDLDRVERRDPRVGQDRFARRSRCPSRCWPRAADRDAASGGAPPAGAP